MKRLPPSKRLEQAFYGQLITSKDPLGQAARLGAQLVLQKGLEAEADSFLGGGHYERSEDGSVRGYRNGHKPKRVHTAEGSFELAVPQIREAFLEVTFPRPKSHPQLVVFAGIQACEVLPDPRWVIRRFGVLDLNRRRVAQVTPVTLVLSIFGGLYYTTVQVAVDTPT